MNKNNSISNLLILVSAGFTVLAYLYPGIYVLGINKVFLDQGLYHIYFIQFFTGTFLHGGFFHLFANSIFLFIFGNTLEYLIGTNKIIYFFIFTTIFIGIMLGFVTTGNTIGISGFCMALLSYYTLELKSRNNPEYKGGITALIINVGIGIHPGISLYGHLFGAIAGVLFYLIIKEFMRKKMVGVIFK